MEKDLTKNLGGARPQEGSFDGDLHNVIRLSVDRDFEEREKNSMQSAQEASDSSVRQGIGEVAWVQFIRGEGNVSLVEAAQSLSKGE